jgi:hypothetical protein
MTLDLSDLELCPFCGGLAEVCEVGRKRRICIECIECGARGPVIMYQPQMSAQGIEQILMHSWNARTICLTDAALDVLDERDRQQTAEGWSLLDDDQLQMGQLADAAACYAVEASSIANTRTGDCPVEGWAPEKWPFAAARWKPAGARRCLVKAGALVLAEIERLDRYEQEKPF